MPCGDCANVLSYGTEFDLTRTVIRILQ